MTFKEGDTLGRYTISRLIGKGGWGEVYEAVDPELDRAIAIKLLTGKLARDPDMQKRFAREARTVAALDHPNIVTIHSVEEVDGYRFLTMQLVRGRTLKELIPKEGMPLDELFDIAIPLSDAVAAAHSKGITHRDLKPANVMVGEDGQVTVLDFGLAKLIPEDDGETLVSGPTPAGSVMGTLSYMSPEQLRGEPADGRSDIYSLGVVLYEMATGAAPFKGQSSLDVAASILRDRPTEVTEIRHALPRHLGRIIRHCMAEEPARRYQSALDIGYELADLKEEIANGLPGAPRRKGPSRRWRFAAFAAAIALAALAGSFLLGRNGAVPAEPVTAPAALETTRLVVLPFADLGEPAVDYFSPGLTEEISNRLAAVDGLGVISRISANQYAGSAKTARQIGDELDVAYILRGSVQWAKDPEGPDRVRILPDLIRVEDDTQAWSERYVASVEEIFDVQSQIAASVAEQLGRRLAGEPVADGRPTRSLEAYQAYLRGLHYARRPVYTLQNWTLAVNGFADAVAQDPEFALAWAWLARANAFLVHLGLDNDGARARLARRAVDRAVELAPDRGEVRLALAYFYYWVESDNAKALAELATAETQLPNHYEIREARGYVLRRQGRWREAVASLEKAFELNPRFADLATEIADTHLWQRGYAATLRWCDESVALDPQQVWAYHSKAQAQLLDSGDLAAARATLERMPPSDDSQRIWTWFWLEFYSGEPQAALDRLGEAENPWVQAWEGTEPVALLRAQALELAGDTEAARAAYGEAAAWLETALASPPIEPWQHSAVGMAYAGLGQPEEAIRSARRAVELVPRDRDVVMATALDIQLALIYARTGRARQALDLLERLLSRPSPLSPALLRIDPRWQALAGERRFLALTRDG